MAIIRELWTNTKIEGDAKDEHHYVIDLKERLVKTWELAHQTLGEMAVKYK